MISVESIISQELKSLGFKKSSRTWRRATVDAIQVVNLQRGFGEQLHVNLGAYLRALGSELKPREEHCHIRARLERVSRSNYFTSVRSLNSSSAPEPDAIDALMSDGISWLNQVSSGEGLSAFLHTEVAANCFVQSSVVTLCQGNPSGA